MNYKIYKDVNSQKYGIRDTNMDITVIKCIFDDIEFYENSGFVRFTLNGMQAVCNMENIRTLEY